MGGGARPREGWDLAHVWNISRAQDCADSSEDVWDSLEKREGERGREGKGETI